MKKIISVFLALVLAVSLFCVTANATTVNAVNKKGKLSLGQSETFTVSLPVKANVTVKLVGLDENYEGTYGDYLLSVTDSNNETVYSVSDYTGYNDKVYNILLESGDYNVSIQENSGSTYYAKLDYVIKINWKAAETVKSTSLKLNKSSLTMKVGATYQLKSTLTPTYSTQTVTYKSSNSKIASVNSKGKVTAKAMGKATVTAKSGELSKKCTVMVNSKVLEYWTGKKVSLNKYVKNISGYKKAKWSSSKSKVVSVSKSGTVNIKKHGKAKITCKIKGKKYTFTVYGYSKKKLKSRAKELLKNGLKRPSSLEIHSVEFSKNFSVIFDYSAMNSFGGYNRSYFYAYYNYGKLYYLFV